MLFCLGLQTRKAIVFRAVIPEADIRFKTAYMVTATTDDAMIPLYVPVTKSFLNLVHVGYNTSRTRRETRYRNIGILRSHVGTRENFHDNLKAP